MNKKTRNITIGFLLLLSMVLLSILVPGGPVETRDFSHINPKILGGFNAFLTSVGIISLLLIYFIIKNQKWSYLMSLFCGLSYFLIYALDLGEIFPVSPTAMPKALLMIEIIGTIVSFPLMYLSLKGFWENKKNKENLKAKPKYFLSLVILMIIIGIGIVIFATKSAMGQ